MNCSVPSDVRHTAHRALLPYFDACINYLIAFGVIFVRASKVGNGERKNCKQKASDFIHVKCVRAQVAKCDEIKCGNVYFVRTIGSPDSEANFLSLPSLTGSSVYL